MTQTKKIVIVDYGLGNLYSITRAIGQFHESCVVSDDVDVILSADALILPGVGAFATGMEVLRKKKLVEALRVYADTGKPLLGICLGAQLLLSKGFEFGVCDGLDIIPGEVVLFPPEVRQKGEKIPHVGWNAISSVQVDWHGTIFDGIEPMSNVYFVHSYIMVPQDKKHVAAVAEYGGLGFCAAIKRGNIYGVQFHPEKSGVVGLQIIKNFIRLA